MGLSPTEELTIVQPDVRLGDPHVSTDDKDSLSIMFSIYEALVRRDQNGGYVPALAGDWSVEDDACTWIFELRKDVAFHNGQVLEAGDVVASLERVRDPEMGGELGSHGVYQSYLEGVLIEALDSRTVRIGTAEPFADLLDLIVKFPIVPRQALAGLPDSPVGSGPYRLAETDDDSIVMRAFSAYWRGEPPVRRIHWRAEPEAAYRVESLLRGDADLIADVTPRHAHRIEDAEQVDIVSADSSVCAVFMCNLMSGVCTDRRVRQALNYALDVPALIEAVVEGAARPLNGPLTAHHFGYDPETPFYDHAPEKAKALLRKAGYSDGLKLVLDVPTTLPDEAPELARKMAEQYAGVGITTTVREFTDRPGYANLVRAKKIDDACCFDSSPLSTYRVFREKLHSGRHGPWWEGYRNPEVDALVDRAAATPDVAQRRNMYRRAYRLVRNDAPWIFLYSPINFWGTGLRARGWEGRIDGLIRLV